jgi:hypothetical protein
MSKTITAFGRIDDGVLHISHRKDFEEEIRRYKGDVCVTVEVGARRRLQQNSWYWLMCTWIAKQLEIQQWGGWTAEDVHEHQKLYCNAKKVTMVTKHGEVIDEDIPQSTARLTIGAFAEYVDRCKLHWAEQGIYIPDTFEGT